MKIAAIIVNYYSAEYVETAVRSILSEFENVSCDGRILVVDNGSHAEDCQLFVKMPVELVGPSVNRGYSGGLNAGIGRAGADFYLLMNADVELLPGSLAALLEALTSGADIAGPRFFWDSECRWVLPPTERRDLVSLALDKFVAKSRLAGELALRRWRNHAWKHWEAESPIESFCLSGALLAVSKRALDVNGLFDEAYRLYFEETDWLERSRKNGLKAVYVPASRVRHYYNRSARQESSSEEWFRQSQKRFEELHQGEMAALLERCAAMLANRSFPVNALEFFDDRMRAIGNQRKVSFEQKLFVEVSPRACGYPAARRAISGGSCWSLPSECLESRPRVSYYARLVEEGGRELRANRFELEDKGGVTEGVFRS